MTQDNNYDGLEEKLDAAINEAFAGLTEKASWVPYEGDRGGVGWRNTESDTVIYDDEPPGGTPEGIPDSLDEMQEQIESGELSVDDIERAVAGEGVDPDEDLEGDDDELTEVDREDLGLAQNPDDAVDDGELGDMQNDDVPNPMGGNDEGDAVESVRDINPRDAANRVHDELVEDGMASLDSYSGDNAVEDAILDASGLDDVTDLGDDMDSEGRLILEDVKDAVRDEVRQISDQVDSDEGVADDAPGDAVESVRDINPRDAANRAHDELVEDGMASLDSYSGDNAVEDAILDASGLDDVTDLGDDMDSEGRLILEDVKDAVRDEVRQISDQVDSGVAEKADLEEKLNKTIDDALEDFSDGPTEKASWVPYEEKLD